MSSLVGGQGVGDWLVFRGADGAAYRRFIELCVRQGLEPRPQEEFQRDLLRAFSEMPVVLGLGVQDRKQVEESVAQLTAFAPVLGIVVATQELKPTAKGVTLTRLTFDFKKANDQSIRQLFADVSPSLCHAFVDGLVCQFQRGGSAQPDRALAGTGHREAAPRDRIGQQCSLCCAGGIVRSCRGRPRLPRVGESSPRRRHGPLWYALIRSRVLKEDASENAMKATALRYLGFIPVSA